MEASGSVGIVKEFMLLDVLCGCMWSALIFVQCHSFAVFVGNHSIIRPASKGTWVLTGSTDCDTCLIASLVHYPSLILASDCVYVTIVIVSLCLMPILECVCIHIQQKTGCVSLDSCE